MLMIRFKMRVLAKLSFETWKLPGKAINGFEAASRALDSRNLAWLVLQISVKEKEEKEEQ